MGVLDLQVREQYVTTADGWSLRLRRTTSPHHFDPSTKPLLIVPGYGMNSFIFSYHPRGTSMERCLAEGGYEVWALDLRGQGHSKPERPRYGESSLVNYATVDLPAAIDRVLGATRTTARTLTLIGCSLGGSIGYGYLALGSRPRVSEMIAMGAPLVWNEIHPLIKVAFSSPTVAGAFRLSGTRALVKTAFPILERVPSLLALYMNPATIHTQRMSEMAQTVEDPEPSVNRDIAIWMRDRDLRMRGVNVTEAMRRQTMPLLVVVSNQDGIVPERTAIAAADVWGGQDVEILRVGDERNWYAHAN
ncbi:MAG TPA: alpha/beta fold hydrolase, partial [Polyangiaceae bacterium]|nr:alpha/beta fold hydrolase [Polyangiaceae bacterium]